MIENRLSLWEIVRQALSKHQFKREQYLTSFSGAFGSCLLRGESGQRPVDVPLNRDFERAALAVGTESRQQD